jgi:Ca2+-binding RTX toxin-like protein
VIELLESRRLFAVSVSEGFPGFFEVTGEDVDDVIVVSINQSARTFTVDGKTYGGGKASYITIYALGGNDTVTVSGTGDGPVGASVLGGDGDDTITLDNVSGAAWGGAGNDQLDFSDSYRAEAYGEDGNDHVTLRGACVDARVHGGDGNDLLLGSACTAPVFFFGEAGNDRLFGSPYGDIIDGGAGRDIMSGLAGDDQFYARDGEPDWILGGDGNDTAICDDVETSTAGTEFPITT